MFSFLNQRKKKKTKTDLDTSPSLVPVPALDSHIVTTSQDQAQRRVNSQTSDIIRVGLKLGNLFTGRDVVHSELEIVRTGNEPVLSGDIANTSDGDVGHFKSLDIRSCLIVPYLDLAITR